MRPARTPIGLELARAARAVSRAFDDALAQAGGSLPAWLVLLNLKTRQVSSQRELAEAVGVREATLTHHLNAMESQGLVTRTRDPGNRRIHVVELTPAGEAAFVRLAEAATAFDRRLRDGLVDADLDVLATVLGRLAANVAGGRGPVGPCSSGAALAYASGQRRGRPPLAFRAGAAMDLFDLSGKTAVVTGGSRGIGLMIARGLLQAGARVYISSRKADACAEAAKELSEHGPVHAIPADLSAEQECLRLASEVGEREQAVHVLVNNAGATWGAPLADYPAAAWDKVVDLNLKTPFFLTRAFLPLLEAAGTQEDPARIINIGSIDGLRVPPFPTYAYSASKAGLHHMTRVLARELGPRRITVNAVAPGPFESKMMAATLDTLGDAIADAAPLKRIGRPDDMAGVAIYLASRAGAYVTGAVIPVDGGIGTTV